MNKNWWWQLGNFSEHSGNRVQARTLAQTVLIVHNPCPEKNYHAWVFGQYIMEIAKPAEMDTHGNLWSDAAVLSALPVSHLTVQCDHHVCSWRGRSTPLQLNLMRAAWLAIFFSKTLSRPKFDCHCQSMVIVNLQSLPVCCLFCHQCVLPWSLTWISKIFTNSETLVCHPLLEQGRVQNWSGWLGFTKCCHSR